MDIKTQDKKKKDLKIDFPSIEGRIFQRPADGVISQEWQAHCYGYGYANYKSEMSPAYIVYAESVEDVKKTVKFAEENNIAIAVRSGSHHYMGGCSTIGNNIQLDLSALFSSIPEKSPWKRLDIDPVKGTVTVGPSVSIGILGMTLMFAGLWLPYGECATVFMGGHAQSGGSSPQLATIGGYLADHVIAFDIVVADGTLKTVYRNKEGQSSEDQELFWALAGGSPGNFGVVTSVTLQCMRDEDYETPIEFSAYPNPNKPGQTYQCMGRYSKERMERLLTFWAKVSDSLDLPEEEWLLPAGASFAISCSASGADPERTEKTPEEDQSDWDVKHFQDGRFYDRSKRENELVGQSSMGERPFTRHHPFWL